MIRTAIVRNGRYLRRTLDEMESALDVASARCLHYGSVNLFPVFSQMLEFVRNEGGESMRVPGDPRSDSIFGPENR
jgi:hypothetical protein